MLGQNLWYSSDLVDGAGENGGDGLEGLGHVEPVARGWTGGSRENVYLTLATLSVAMPSTVGSNCRSVISGPHAWRGERGSGRVRFREDQDVRDFGRTRTCEISRGSGHVRFHKVQDVRDFMCIRTCKISGGSGRERFWEDQDV